MKSSNYIKIEFPSKSSNEGLARAITAAFAAQLDPTLDEIGDLKTAVSEAVTNATVHAYPEAIGLIQMRLRILKDDYLEIMVKDKGRGIDDIEKALQPLYTTGGDDRCGMGFTIMDSFMDKMKVRSRPGKGTTVVMGKRLREKK